jgi:hypothetical protein
MARAIRSVLPNIDSNTTSVRMERYFLSSQALRLVGAIQIVSSATGRRTCPEESGAEEARAQGSVSSCRPMMALPRAVVSIPSGELGGPTGPQVRLTR